MEPTDFLARIQEEFSRKRLDLILISKLENVRYLTGFTGSSGFVVATSNRALFVTDPRYTEQAERECVGWEVVELRGKRLSEWMAEEFSPKRVGVEESLTLGDFNRLKKNMPLAEWEVLSGLIEGMRVSKSEREIELIRKAVELVEDAYEYVLRLLKSGVSEREVALEIELFMRRRGASHVSFPVIVASGARSSLPHGVASDKVIETGDLVLLDFGCVYEGYCSDMTRVVKLGKVNEEERKVWQVVYDAHQRVLDAIEKGERDCRKLHLVAQDVMREKGLDSYFGHGLGHGVGLEIHERPSLSSLSEETLVDGAVFTVEPGIYLPKRFGVRLENMYWLSNEQLNCFNRSSLDIVEL